MADESGSVWSITRRATIYTIVVGIVGGLISWIVGWLPAVWQAIQTTTAWTWGLLRLSVPVPLVILSILVLPPIIWIVRATRQAFAQEAPAAPQEPTEPPLNDLEQKLLQLLAHEDGRYLKFEDAADHLGVSRLLLERACEVLEHRGFIKSRIDVLHGAQIVFTRAGRDFVIEQGFILGRTPRTW